jgi:restriction system protein
MYGLLAANYAHGAVIITSGIFTQEAKNFASGKPIDLVEGKQLADLVGSVQKTAAGASKVQVNQASTVNVCPKCGAELVVRTVRKGANAGKQFYGCSRFPACRYTRE